MFKFSVVLLVVTAFLVVSCSHQDKRENIKESYGQRSTSKQNRKIASLPEQIKKLDPRKKNVCSITINSVDEINQFRKHLGNKHFNYIELIPDIDSPGGKRSWMSKACTAGVSCDLLVVSGHFGGSFFGFSGFELQLSELEKLSCDTKCDGILRNPKEVFLFGCNTLAGKNRDSRTESEYRNVLIEDGFSREQAELIAAFRYSSVGASFHDRMSRIFRGVPKIYGFDGIAPSGRNVRGYLGEYFKALPTDYSTFLSSVDNQGKNRLLAEHLRQTTFTETRGVNISSQNIPACFLLNKKVPRVQRLEWIQKKLLQENPLEEAMSFYNFFKNESYSNINWNEKEKKILKEISKNKMAKNKIKKFVAKPNLGILGIQLEIASLAYKLKLFNKPEYRKSLDDLIDIRRRLQEGLDREYVDTVCSQSQGLGLNFKLKDQYFDDKNFISLIQCLGFSKLDPETQIALNKMIMLRMRDLDKQNNDFTEMTCSLYKDWHHYKYSKSLDDWDASFRAIFRRLNVEVPYDLNSVSLENSQVQKIASCMGVNSFRQGSRSSFLKYINDQRNLLPKPKEWLI